MKLSIIIVNYNVRYFLEQALYAVQKAIVNIEADVWVVDNASKDDSVEMVREKFPWVRLIANEGNPGFSIANNQAIRESNAEYVLLLNPDTVVEEDTFEKCIDFMDARPQAGGLGVKMIDGSGNFLPESKRGFPSPWVAFCKTFGLSTFFPKSKLFNHYHLGYLDKDENHEVEVLAGAFMMMRKSVLDEVGLLDETFFMYGEDIDLSYRIIKGGYKNYYCADTTIIHYKGESTKRGSLNYVKVFYNAMIIFAKKHFKGEKAWVFVLMLQMAIYFRAFLTVVSNVVRKAYLPLIDLTVMLGGMWLIKEWWADYYYKNDDHFQPSYLYFNTPMYALLWLNAIFFSGGYDEPFNLRRLVRGVLVGTVIISAIYAFLPQDLRSSRAVILLGTVWTLGVLTLVRYALHYFKYKSFNVGRSQTNNLILVGSAEECQRVNQLLQNVNAQKNLIGFVAPEKQENNDVYLSSLNRLDEVVYIYKVNEIIFCSKDIAANQIMHWMTQLGPSLDYRIVPRESLSIIGSSSKNTQGELYTIDIQFKIASPMARRNKRVLDLMVSGICLILSPILWLFQKHKMAFFRNIFQVFFGSKTWVGYTKSGYTSGDLPSLKPSVLNPSNALNIKDLDAITQQRLDFLYAKDYGVGKDLDVVLRSWRDLGATV